MTHPMIYALGLGVAIGVAVFTYFATQSDYNSRDHQHSYRREHRPPSNRSRSPEQQRRRRQSSTDQHERSNSASRQYPAFCTICLEDNSNDMVRINCGHHFHLDCMQKLANPVCPNCRSNL